MLDDTDVATVPLGSTQANDPPAATDATTPTDSSGLYSGLVELKSKEMAAKTKTYDEVTAGIERDQARVQALSKDLGVEAGKLKPWNAEEESAKRHTDPVAAFGSLGSVFGILASAFTRAPMENALNASAAAMGAIKDGDTVAYNRAYKAWEDNTKQAMDRHKIQHDAYTDATTMLNTNIAAGQAKLQVLAAKYGDEKTKFLLDNGLNKEVIDLQEARQKLYLEMEQAKPKLAIENIKMSDLLGRGYDPKDPTSPKSTAALQGWQQDWNGRKYDEDAQFSSKWWAENPEGTSDEFKEAFGAWKEETKPDKTGASKRIPKPEEAEINRRKDEKIAAGMDPAKAYEEAVREVKVAGATPSGNRMDDLRGKIDRVGLMEDIINKVEDLLKKHKAITGLGGTITRPGEVVGNIFGSNETDRVQFKRYISELQEWGPRVLNDSNGRPLSAEVAKINSIIAGLQAGDTAANTARAYLELRQLLAKVKSNLNARLGGGTAAPVSEPPQTKVAPWSRDPVAQ